MIGTRFQGGLAGLALATCWASTSAQAQDLTPRWTHQSDTEAWTPRHVALGDEGSEVMAQLEGADLHRRILVFGQSVPAWQQSDDLVTLRQRVASAARASVHAALRDEPIPGSPGQFRVLVRLHVSDPSLFPPGGAPTLPVDWSLALTEQTSGHDNLALVATPDGHRVAAVVYQGSTATNVATVIAPGGGSVVRRPLTLAGPVQHARISDDGTRLLTASAMQAVVTDLVTGSALWNTFFTSPLERGVALSADGTIAATGTQSLLRVWRLDTSSGTLAWSYTHPDGARCTDLAVSADGSTLAATFSKPEAANTVSVTWFDLPASNALGAPVVRTTRIAATGATTTERGAGLEISADGLVTALGLWGDAGGEHPEVIVWDDDDSPDVRTAQLPGSVQRLALSPDGLRLAVASKATHNEVWGGGGRIDLYDVGAGDIGYRGAPRRGHTIDVDVRGEPLRPVRLLLASRLASTPVERAGLGTLFLDRMALIDVVPLGATDASGELVAPFAIPSSWPVGSPVYLQGMTVAPARLTESWVKLTVLP